MADKSEEATSIQHTNIVGNNIYDEFTSISEPDDIKYAAKFLSKLTTRWP